MWNYRLIKHEGGRMADGADNSWLSVHEVFYDQKSQGVDVIGYTKEHVVLGGMTKEDILSKLETIKRDVEAMSEPLSGDLVEPTKLGDGACHEEDSELYHWEYSVTDKRAWKSLRKYK